MGFWAIPIYIMLDFAASKYAFAAALAAIAAALAVAAVYDRAALCGSLSDACYSLSINRPKSHTAGYSSFGTHAIRTLRCRHRLAIA